MFYWRSGKPSLLARNSWIVARGPFFDGKVHVHSRMCSTCIFRPGNLMHLEPGRVEDMVCEATRNDSCIPCHQTLDGKQAVCRGFFDKHATSPLQVAERMGFVEFVDPPKKESK